MSGNMLPHSPQEVEPLHQHSTPDTAQDSPTSSSRKRIVVWALVLAISMSCAIGSVAYQASEASLVAEERAAVGQSHDVGLSDLASDFRRRRRIFPRGLIRPLRRRRHVQPLRRVHPLRRVGPLRRFRPLRRIRPLRRVRPLRRFRKRPRARPLRRQHLTRLVRHTRVPSTGPVADANTSGGNGLPGQPVVSSDGSSFASGSGELEDGSVSVNPMTNSGSTGRSEDSSNAGMTTAHSGTDATSPTTAVVETTVGSNAGSGSSRSAAVTSAIADASSDGLTATVAPSVPSTSSTSSGSQPMDSSAPKSTIGSTNDSVATGAPSVPPTSSTSSGSQSVETGITTASSAGAEGSQSSSATLVTPAASSDGSSATIISSELPTTAASSGSNDAIPTSGVQTTSTGSGGSPSIANGSVAGTEPSENSSESTTSSGSSTKATPSASDAVEGIVASGTGSVGSQATSSPTTANRSSGDFADSMKTTSGSSKANTAAGFATPIVEISPSSSGGSHNMEPPSVDVGTNPPFTKKPEADTTTPNALPSSTVPASSWNMLVPSHLTVKKVDADQSSLITPDEIYAFLKQNRGEVEQAIQSQAIDQLAEFRENYARTEKCVTDGLKVLSSTNLSESDYHTLVTWMMDNCSQIGTDSAHSTSG